MEKVMNPEKAVAYCAMVLSELSLNPNRENSLISPNRLYFDFFCIAMPRVRVEGCLSDEQLAQINDLCEQNRNSSLYRFAKIYRHFHRKIYKCLQSQVMEDKQNAWLFDPANEGIDVKESPLVMAEERLFKWARRASDKALPGFAKSKVYSEYLISVFDRLD
jgi:hypothetical protein